jgi:hypothetical protein
MTSHPLGADGLPPWDVICIHYTCNPARTDVLMRASHIIGDGQLFMKLIKQIMDPLDAKAEADFAATVLNCDSSSSDKATGSRAAGKAAAGRLGRAAGSSSSPADESAAAQSDSGSIAGDMRSEGSSDSLRSSSSSSSSTSSETDEDEQQQQQPDGCSREKCVLPQQQKQPQPQQQLQHEHRKLRRAWQSVCAFFKIIWK